MAATAQDRPQASRPGAKELLEQVPPHDALAEACVLGSMLMEPAAADIAVEELTEQDFYVPRHRALFAILATLLEKHRDLLDEVFVHHHLVELGKLDEIGGPDELGKLMHATPSASNIEGYCHVVRERAVERELILAAGRILQLVHEPSSNDSQALAEAAEKLVYEIADSRKKKAETVPMGNVIAAVAAEAERNWALRREGKMPPSSAVPTHFSELDEILAGGFWPGELVILAGRPGMGKTTFALNIVRKICVGNPNQVRPAAIFSLEMPKEQIAKNMLCAEASQLPDLRITSKKMRRYDFTEDELEAVKLGSMALQAAPIYIDDTSGLSIPQLRARCRRLRHGRMQNDPIQLVVVDYLQLMRVGGGTLNKNWSREREVAELSRSLKELARELSIPIIVLAQLNRSLEKSDRGDKVPQLSDLRESGAIEQDADVVIMLHRDEYFDIEKDANPVNIGKALVRKNRNGETKDAKLTFFKDILRFETWAQDHDAAAGA